MRGILNKLTPEKFDKLINDILNIGLDSSTVLKGVIVLVSFINYFLSKASSVQEPFVKCLAVHILKFEISQTNKEIKNAQYVGKAEN